MTEAEYKAVTSRMRRLWPSLGAWMAGLDAESQEGIRERWRMSLLRVAADSANAAIDELAAGESDPWPFPSDKERAAAIVCGIVKRKRESSDLSEHDHLGMRRPKRSDGYRSDGTYARILDAIAKDDRHSDECREGWKVRGRCLPTCQVPGLVGAEIGAEDVGLREDAQRFDCALCRDTGYVSCLRHNQVAEVAHTHVVPIVMRTYSARCGCSYGQSKANREQYREFDAGLDVPALQAKRALVASCVAFAEAIAKRGRVPSFDEWNQQAEAVA